MTETFDFCFSVIGLPKWTNNDWGEGGQDTAVPLGYTAIEQQ